MMNQMKNPPLLAALMFVAMALAISPGSAQETDAAVVVVAPPYDDYVFTRTDRLSAAQACVHEATWAGAEHTGDCGGIIQVVMERRRPRETFSRALERTMPRFYAGVTSRSWTRHLPSGPLRTDPAGWPYEYPARVHDDAWLAVNLRVSRYMRGEEPLPCAPTPDRWFGRTTDGEVLARTLSEGLWCEARCGESRNAFLSRCRVLSSPATE